MPNNRAKKMKTSLVYCAVLSALSSTTVFSAEASSEITDASEATESQQLEHIMVTSRRKNESIIEIPMNVSTVGALEIADRNLLSKQDLFRSVAGAASPRGELILRGLSGGNESGGSLSPTPIGTTTTFTDGIPYDFDDLYDVERVEILRGPQGTLYGSNAIGGTVRIISKRPQLDEFEVNASLQVNGEKDVHGTDQRVYASINMPISEQIALRVTGSSSDQPLSITNVNTGVQGNIRSNFIRAQLLWQPQDDLSLNFGYIHDELERIGTDTADLATGGSDYEAALTANPDAPFGYDVEIVPGTPCDLTRVECKSSGYIAGGVDQRYNAWELMDRRTNDDTDMYTLNIKHDNFFDFATLSYDGSYRDYDDYVGLSSNWSRSDGSDMFRTWLVNDFQKKRTTHELRLGSLDNGSNIDWTVGYFYDKDEKGDGPNRQDQYHGDGNEGKAIASAFWGDYWSYFVDPWEAPDGSLQVISTVAELGMMYWGNPDINYSEETLVEHNIEKSLFGEISYTLETADIGEFEFTAGIRFYDLEDRLKTEIKGIWGSTAESNTRPDLPEGTHTISGNDSSGSESGNRKKLSVSWRPDNTMSLYALYAEGYRPAGSNISTLPQSCRDDKRAQYFQSRYESDAIDNYELGYKASLFNNKMKISTAVYQIGWTGVQVDIGMGCGFGFISNAADARSRGIELETTTDLENDLTLTFNAGYTSAEMAKDFEPIGAEKGDDMTQVPDYNVYLALDKGFELFNRQAYVRLDFEAYGEYESHFNPGGEDGDEGNGEEDTIPSYEKFNLSGRIELKDGINASLHVNNLFDKEIINWRSTTDNSYGNYHYVEYANARNVTFRLDFTF